MKFPVRLPRISIPLRSPAPSPVLAPYRRFSPRLPLRLLCALALFVAMSVWGASYALTFPYLLVPLAVPAVAIAALVIWALPESSRPPVQYLAPLFFAFAAGMYLWPNYLAIALPGLPWLTVLRVIGTPMALFLLICLSVSADFRKQLGAVMTTDTLVWRMLLAFLVIEFMSIGFSSQTGASLARFSITLTNWYAVFFVGLYVFSRPGAAAKWALLIWGCAVVLALIAIWENRLGRAPWADHIPSFLRVDDPSVQRTLRGSTRGGMVARRVAATTNHPLALAEFLGLMVPFAVHFVMQKYPLWLRISALISLPLIGNAILLTDSRLGFGAGLLSVVVYLFMWAALRWKRTKSSVFAPALVLMYPIIFALFMVATFAIGRLRAEVWGGGQTQASSQARIDQWNAGIPKILSHPWGHGIGRSGDTLGFANGAGVVTVDTYYLTLLLDFGILGFLLYMGLFVRGIWLAGRAGISPSAKGELLLLIPISIALLNFVVIKSVLSAESNHPLLFAMMAAVLALTARVRAAEKEAREAAPASAPIKIASPRGLQTGSGARLNRR